VQVGREHEERRLIDAAGNAQVVRPAARRAGREGGRQQAPVGRQSAQARHREAVAARLFGDADHPGASSAIGKEGAHRRAEVGVQQFAIFRVPDERQIAAKHAAIVLRTFDGDRLMHRSARGETDETRDVHARQGLRDRSRG
jgi:hypothetical protein